MFLPLYLWTDFNYCIEGLRFNLPSDFNFVPYGSNTLQIRFYKTAQIKLCRFSAKRLVIQKYSAHNSPQDDMI